MVFLPYGRAAIAVTVISQRCFKGIFRRESMLVVKTARKDIGFVTAGRGISEIILTCDLPVCSGPHITGTIAGILLQTGHL